MACRCANPGDLILHLYGRFVPSATRRLRTHHSEPPLAGGNMKPLSVKLEMVNERFHGSLHLAGLGGAILLSCTTTAPLRGSIEV
jgi:hypothetical protein